MSTSMSTAAEKPIKPITVNGLTGREPQPKDDDAYYVWQVVRYHNQVVELAQAEDRAWAAYSAAEAAAEAAWQALGATPTSEWAAAHHRWIVAEHVLDNAAHAWDAAAAHMERRWDEERWGDHSYDVYDQILQQTGVRGLAGFERPISRYLLQTNLKTRRREREEMAAKTLKHLPA